MKEIYDFIDSDVNVTLQSGVSVNGIVRWKDSDGELLIRIEEKTRSATFEHLIHVDQIVMISIKKA